MITPVNALYDSLLGLCVQKKRDVLLESIRTNFKQVKNIFGEWDYNIKGR